MVLLRSAAGHSKLKQLTVAVVTPDALGSDRSWRLSVFKAPPAQLKFDPVDGITVVARPHRGRVRNGKSGRRPASLSDC